MNSTLFFDRFRFFEIERNAYHYSDNRNGSPEHYLACMLRGRCRIVSQQGCIDVTEGDVFYIPMGLPYQSYWYGEPEIRFLSYGFQLFPDAAHTDFRLQVIPCIEEIKAAIRAIPTGRYPNSAALGAFFTVLSQLVPRMASGSLDRSERVFRAAQQYLYDHPEGTARELARRCGVSESTLYSIFKARTGKTPNVVRQEILCEKAVLLLMTTDHSVQEISDTLGFSSTSYFRKILKQHTQKSPREIRRDARLM